MLPLHASITTQIQVYEDGQLKNNNTSYDFLNILTDFIGNDLIFTPFVEYVPSIYRYVDLKPNSSIRTVDLQIYWQNKNNGKLKPLYLVPGGSCSIKLYLTKE